MQLPDTLDDDLLEILGRPNFMCGGIANAMRAEGVNIPRKSEAEQAHVLFKLIGLYAQHGEGWRVAAADWIYQLGVAQLERARTDTLVTSPHPHP